MVTWGRREWEREREQGVGEGRYIASPPGLRSLSEHLSFPIFHSFPSLSSHRTLAPFFPLGLLLFPLSFSRLLVCACVEVYMWTSSLLFVGRVYNEAEHSVVVVVSALKDRTEKRLVSAIWAFLLLLSYRRAGFFLFIPIYIRPGFQFRARIIWNDANSRGGRAKGPFFLLFLRIGVFPDMTVRLEKYHFGYFG